MKQEKESSKSLVDLYKEAFKFIYESRSYICLSLGIFLLAFFAGFFISPPANIEADIIDFLKSIMLRFDGLSITQTIWEIFSNNLSASFFGLILGFLLFTPFITTLLNGYLVGFVAEKAVSEAGIFILWRILPHGIF